MAMYHVAVLLLLAHFASIPHSLACPYCPTPTTPPKKSPPPPPPPSPCPPPPGMVPPSPKTPSTGACPIDTLKLDACVDLLGGLVHAVIGQDTKDKCCPVIQGLADLDAALEGQIAIDFGGEDAATAGVIGRSEEQREKHRADATVVVHKEDGLVQKNTSVEELRKSTGSNGGRESRRTRSLQLRRRRETTI
ncbi:hypothetical protein BHM03_00049022 [Ensete ventricosum]|nr:hypothetical protein BHM03_00049022 [Ensete ventricosum]